MPRVCIEEQTQVFVMTLEKFFNKIFWIFLYQFVRETSNEMIRNLCAHEFQIESSWRLWKSLKGENLNAKFARISDDA